MPEPIASNRYTEPVAAAEDNTALSAYRLLLTANIPPETMHKQLRTAKEVMNIGPGPRISPGTREKTVLLARAAKIVSGNNTARSVCNPANNIF